MARPTFALHALRMETVRAHLRERAWVSDFAVVSADGVLIEGYVSPGPRESRETVVLRIGGRPTPREVHRWLSEILDTLCRIERRDRTELYASLLESQSNADDETVA